MSHIFISYSHKDSEYAHKLADTLQSKGFSIWIDERLDYGSQWPHEIEKQLDSCSAFILLMSPRAFASDWVQSELQRAKRRSKPIFPLLLEGDGPWLSVESTQYYDVRNGEMPNERFFSALSKHPTMNQNAETFIKIPKSSIQGEKVNPKSTVKRESKIKTEIWVAIIGAIATLCTAGITIFFTIFWDRIIPHTADSTSVAIATEGSVPNNTESSITNVQPTLKPNDTSIPTQTMRPNATATIPIPTSTPQNICDLYNTVPLNLYYNFDTSDNFTVATQAGINQAIQANYQLIGIEGRIFTEKILGTVPLYLYYNFDLFDNFTVSTEFGTNQAITANYQLIRTEGYIFPNNKSDTIPLNLYYLADPRYDNFSAATNYGKNEAERIGYTFIRVEGYICP